MTTGSPLPSNWVQFAAEAPLPMIVVDRTGRIVHVNRLLCSLVGYSEEELIGREVNELALESDQTIQHEAFERAYANAGEAMQAEVRWTHASNSPVAISLHVRAAKDGRLTLIAEPFGADQSETARRSAEDHGSLRMEAVGRLAGGVAHDFNNLLTIIAGHTELLLDQLPEGDPLREEVAEIKKAADRAAALTRQLLAFGRRQVLAPQVLEFDSLLEHIEPALRRIAGVEVKLEFRRDDHGARVKADPAQLEDALIKLVRRAREAMPQGGGIVIESARCEVNKDYLHGHRVQRGHYLVIRVIDSSPALDADVRAHIFEPFYKSPKAQRGTDLSLATVYGIIKQSGGYIWVNDDTREGNEFELLMPLIEETAEAPRIPPRAEKISGRGMPAAAQTTSSMPARPAAEKRDTGRQTVLLVEDEEAIRWLARAVLQLNGYTVLEARDGNEALSILETDRGRVDLLLTDVVMPQMSGHELSRRLAQTHPETKVLYMSGYGESVVVRHENGDNGQIAFLQKPFTGESLARKVREVLNPARAA